MFEIARVGSKTIQGGIQLKEKSFGFLSTFSIQERFLVAINEGWKKFLGDNPTFEVIIDKDGRYCLLGPKVNSPNRTKRTPAKEDKHV